MLKNDRTAICDMIELHVAIWVIRAIVAREKVAEE
jgi:hypothetical protein